MGKKYGETTARSSSIRGGLSFRMDTEEMNDLDALIKREQRELNSREGTEVISANG